jgi:drug/metabolite transporter (DMT)-like permease
MRRENLTGAALMTLAMLGFAVEDALIKLAAGAIPTWQIMLVFGAGGSVVYAVILRLQNQRLWSRDYLSAAVLARNMGELFGIIGGITALALIDLSTVSAVFQAAPLLVTLGAAVFLGEVIRWRRWMAIAVGFVGVLCIIQPGTQAFDWPVLFAVQALVGLAIRDIATRRISSRISSSQLSFLGMLMALPAAGLLAFVTREALVVPNAAQAVLLLALLVVGVGAYYLITSAMRLGEVSVVTSFRYTRIVFAIVLGFAVFDERPDWLMFFGIFLVIAAGLYTLWREARLEVR